jgi:hypothetical protein
MLPNPSFNLDAGNTDSFLLQSFGFHIPFLRSRHRRLTPYGPLHMSSTLRSGLHRPYRQSGVRVCLLRVGRDLPYRAV